MLAQSSGWRIVSFISPQLLAQHGIHPLTLQMENKYNCLFQTEEENIDSQIVGVIYFLNSLNLSGFN